MPAFPFRYVPLDEVTGYTLASYPSSTPSEARKIINRKLKGKTFAINVNTVNKAELPELDNDQDVNAAVVTSGVIIANAYQELGTNTGTMYAGGPVVFDTVTGRAVTGINQIWSPEEYTIVGYALQGLGGGIPGFFRLPIMLGFQKLPDAVRYGVLQENLLAGGQAEVRCDNYDPARGSAGLDMFSPEAGIALVHTGSESRNILPEGMMLPAGSVITMGLLTANRVPVWILLGSPVCPVEA